MPIMNRLFLNRLLKKSGPPIHLIWFVTSGCNLRCSHCFCRERVEGAADEFSFEEIRKTVSHLSPLLSVTLTGGEPFLRKDLPEIAGLFSREKLTKNIILYSNGFEPDIVLAASGKMLSGCPDIDFRIGISVDGFEKEHDKYRNKAGSYEKAMDTIRGLKALKKHFPNLYVGVGITLHGGNQHIVKDLRKSVYSSFGIVPGITLIRGVPRQAELKNVDAGVYKETVKEIERDRKACRKNSLPEAIIAVREIEGQKLAYKTYASGARSYDCYAGFLMGVIYETGDVYPCETLSGACMGNLRDHGYDINKIWDTPAADKVRDFIKDRKCSCTYECQYTCNTLYNIRMSGRFVTGVLGHVLKSVYLGGIKK